MKLLSPDDYLFFADWPKRTWDLPPYKSKEFFEIVPEASLPQFRKLPVYKFAVIAGRIKDDKWVR